MTLRFEDAALDYIVDKAVEYKLGARGLRGLTETIMIDLMYEIPEKKLTQYTVTREYAEQKLQKDELFRLQQAV